MGFDDGLCVLRVRGARHVHGRVRAGNDAVLRERRAALQLERDVERAVGVYESSVRARRVHWRVHAGRQAMQRPRPADVRLERAMGERLGVPVCVHGRQLHGLHARSEAMQQPATADLRLGRELAEHDAVHQPSLRWRQLRGRVYAKCNPVRGEQRRDVLVGRRVG